MSMIFIHIFCILTVFQVTVCVSVYKLQPGDYQCIQLYSQEDSLLNNCINFADFLTQTNDSATEIRLTAGQYKLNKANVSVRYSLSLIATEPETYITCEGVNHTGNGTGMQLRLTSDFTTNITLSGITFQNCVFSFKFDHLKSLLIDNCTFRDFTSAAVDIFNVLNVRIFDTHFINNSVNYTNEQYKATSAGLSLSYRFKYNPGFNPSIVVQRCTFEENYSRLPGQGLSEQIFQVFSQDLYPARGGGLGIIITEEFTNLSMTFSNCYFISNYADSFGGAVYMVLDGNRTVHSIKFINSIFYRNRCSKGGGAVVIGNRKQYNIISSEPTVFVFEDCLFERNNASSGGGILTLRAHVSAGRDYLIVRRSNFTRNKSTHGSAIIFGSLFNVQVDQSAIPSVVEDCLFDNNMSPGGTLIAGFTNIYMKGNNYLQHNVGPTMLVIGCLVQVMGNLTFTANRDTVAGGVALQLSSFAQIKLFKESHMNFYNNSGILGSAIRVDLQQFPTVYSGLIGNPLCFILYEDENIPPIEWSEGLIYFSGNQAQLGSAIYGSYFDLCSYYSNNKFDISKFPYWPVFSFGLNNNTGHENSTDRKYYIQTPALSIDADMSKQTLKLYPGEESTLIISGLDQFNNPTYFVARVIDQVESLGATLSSLFDITPSFTPPTNYSNVYNEENISVALFNPQLLPVYPNRSNDVSYSLDLPEKFKQQLTTVEDITGINKTILVQIENEDGFLSSNVMNITLEVRPCLPGYQMLLDNENNAKCICVGARDKSSAVLECDDDNNTIILRNGYWSGFNTKNGRINLNVYTCPVTYCQCILTQDDNCVAEYDYYNPDLQCHPPRTGTLCGLCGPNATVSILRLQCREDCGNNYQVYYGVVILIVVDIGVVVIVILASIKFSIPLPHSLRAVLFYIQTAYIVTEYFPVSFWRSREYMLYISNLLGLYFPVDFCFLNNVPSVLTFAPRFIPPLLVFIIPLFFLCWKRGRRKIWNGVWSLILLTYAPLCYTCMTLLHCPTLADINGHDYVRRWYLDASIKCFSDPAHIVLGTLAIVFLLGMIALIPIVIALVLLEDHEIIQKKFPYMLNIIKALKAGYRPYRAWWSGVELICRLLLVGIAVGLPGRTVAPIYMISLLFVIQIYIQPYKYHIQNFIEGLVLVDYVFLLITRFPQELLDSLNENYSSIAIPNNYLELPPPDGITYFFLPFFYMPVGIGIIVGCTWIVYKLIQTNKGKRKQSEIDIQSLNELPINTSLDHYIDHDNHTYTSTVSFLDIEDLKMNNETI